MALVIDTRTVPRSQRVGYWAESNRAPFNPLHMSGGSGDDFEARLWGESLGPIGVFRIAASGGTMSRTVADVAAGDPECVQLSLLLSGSLHCAQDRRLAAVGAGEMTSYVTSAPAIVRAPGPFEMLALRVPRAMLRERGARVSRLTALPIPATSGWPRLMAQIFRELADGLDGGAFATDDGELIELTLHLLRHLYANVDAAAATRARPRADLLMRAQAYIDARLEDPELTPDQVAHACYASLRSLHYAFAEADLTVGRWIGDQRLARARRELMDRTLRHETVAAIARRSGFVSAAHFSRRFRAAYGQSPTDLRRTLD